MAFIKKNVNIFLLFLIVAVITGLVGITAYYQLTYRELSDDYTSKVNSLNKISKQLTSRVKELNDTKTDLRLREEDTQKFEGLYGDVLSEKDVLQGELTSTEDDLKQKLLQLQQSRADVRDLNDTIKIKENDIKDLKNDLDDVQDQVCALQAQFNLSKESYC